MVRSRAFFSTKRKNLFSAARVLLVDDDDIFRSEFGEYFEEYGITEAPNGEEALKILKKPNEIDLVLLDVHMSGMDGIEVLEHIKKIAPKVKVVILTGYGSKDIAIDALRNHADDYIEKSLTNHSVREIIEKHLDAKAKSEYGIGIEGKISRVKNFIEKNYHKRIGLNDAASLVCLSPKYLSRVFNEYAKIGFNEYVLSLRMGKAKKLLEETTDTIEQISDQLGYQNPESFIRQFKKLTKLTPRAFRVKNGKKDNHHLWKR